MTIEVKFDQGELPSILEALQDRKLAALAAKAAAEKYHEEILGYIGEGKSFVSRSGHLEGSIGWRPDGDGAVVYANAEYAEYVERGTGLHGPYGKSYVIKPKHDGGRKSLRKPIPGGSYLHQKIINHPGMKAKPFFFADFEDRKEKMQDAMTSVIARKLGLKE